VLVHTYSLYNVLRKFTFSLFASNSNVAYYLSVAVEGDEGERKTCLELEFVAGRVGEGWVGRKWKREEMNLLGDKYAQLWR